MPYNPKPEEQGMSRRERALGHQKGTVTTVGVGTPELGEGSDGDFTLRKTAQGLTLFIKSDNRWHDVKSLGEDVWNEFVNNIYTLSPKKVGIGTASPGSLLEISGAAGTGADSAGVLTLSTKEPTVRVASVDQLGRIDFQAPLESGGTDAILVGASIGAVCEEDFSSSNNSTALFLSTGTTTVPIERMRIDQDGLVGIGTASPTVDLHVKGSGGTYITVESTDNEAGVQIMSDSSNHWTIYSPNSSDDLRFYRAGDVVSFTSSSVGINKTVPGNILDVSHAQSSIGIHSTTSSSCAWLEINDPANIIYLGIDNDAGNCLIGTAGSANKAVLTTPGSTDFWFGTNNAARMVILDDGKVGIGILEPTTELHVQAAANDHAAIYVEALTSGYSTNLVFREAGTSLWAIGVDGSNDNITVYDEGDSSVASHMATTDNDWQAGSDLRIKKDIENIDSVLDSINSLRPITWKRKYGNTDRAYPGLVAQEVLPHIPLVVSGTEDSFKEITKDGNSTYRGGLSIGYSNFVPYLIKAIQELSAKVEALENA